MTEEEKIVETEKSREKYFYVDKEKTCQVITGIATSFIGASLALLLFAALHKPPVPPCGMQFNRPMPCPMRMLPPGPRPEFGNPHKHFRGQFNKKHFKDFKQGNDIFLPPEGLRPEPPVPPTQKPTPTPKK